MKKAFNFQPPHPAEVDERYHAYNAGNIAYTLYWKNFFDMAKDIPGNIVECGVGRGRSMVTLASLNRILEKDEGGERKIWGFDSFEGFSEPAPEDCSPRNPKKGEWAHSPSGKYQYTVDFIYDVLKRAYIDNPEQDITLVKGFLKDSLKNYDRAPIAILHIDCDLYEPYKETLEALYPFVSPGGIIIFDDFMLEEDKNEPFPGARRATYEFLGNEKDKLAATIKGNPFYCKPA